MKMVLLPLLTTLFSTFQRHTLLHLEILALRQQLAMVNQTSGKRPRFHWGSTAVLGLALPAVAWLSADTPGFQTGYPGALAPQGLSAVLDLEVSLQPGRTPTHRSQGARTYQNDVSRQGWLGCAANSRRTADARHHRLPGDCCKVHDPSSKTTLSNMADISAQSCQ